MHKYQLSPLNNDHLSSKTFFSRHINRSSNPERLSQLVAIDVIFKHQLLHGVTDHGAEGTHSVTLLVLVQLVLGYAGEALLAVTTHQDLMGTEIEAAH